MRSKLKNAMGSLSFRLFWLGIFAAIAKLLGFTEASWWLVLMPIYLPFVLAFGIILLSIPILLLLGVPFKEEKNDHRIDDRKP